MTFSYQTRPLDKLCFPETLPDFLCQTFDDANTCDCITRFGQLHPLPVIQQDQDTYQLVGAYTIFAAMRALKQETADCQIIQPMDSAIQEYTLRVLLNGPALQASPILCAYLLLEARERLDEKELLTLLPYMGYKAGIALLRQILSLVRLAPKAILALHQGALSLKSALRLLEFSPAEQELVVHCILTYQLGGSKQQKLVEMLRELSLRHNRGVEYWLDACLSRSTEQEANRPQQVQNLMHFLREQCNPALSKAEKDFASFVHDLKPCTGLRIRHSPCFEDFAIEVSVQFSDRETLQKHWRKVTDLALLASETAP